MLDEARRLLASGDAASAAARAEQALAAGESRADALRVKASALLQLGRPAEAQVALRELCDLRPDDAWAYVMLGRLHLGAGRVGKARAMAERAVLLDPQSAEVQAFNRDIARGGQAMAAAAPRRGKKSLALPIAIAAALVLLVLVAVALIAFAHGQQVQQAAGTRVAQSQVQNAPAPAQPQPQVQTAPPPAPAQPEVHQAPPAQPQQPTVMQAPPQQPAQAQVTQSPPQEPAQPQMTQAPPMSRPGNIKLVWYRARLVRQETMEGQVVRKYQIWGQVENDGDTSASGVVVGWISEVAEHVAWGVQSLDNVPPRSTYNFSMIAPARPQPIGTPPGDSVHCVAGPMTASVKEALGSLDELMLQLGLSNEISVGQ